MSAAAHPETLCILHGIAPGSASTPGSAPPHGRLAFAGLTLLTSPCPPQRARRLDPSRPGPTEQHPLPPDDAAALAAEAAAHNALLCAYAAKGDVLPVRFGTVFESTRDLQTSLTPRLSAYRVALAEIAGHAEFTLRATRAEAPISQRAPHPSGRAFLAARRAARHARVGQDQAEAAALASARATLNPCARATVSIRPAAGEIGAAAFLVAREAIGAFVAQAAACHADLAARGLTVAVAGPWPPYSFAPTAVSEAA